MINRFPFLLSILSITCHAQATVEKQAIKTELIKLQAQQRMIIPIRNICGSLAALGILSTIACYALTKESPYMFYKMGPNPSPKSLSDFILGAAAYACVTAAHYIPLATFVAIATHLYSNNNEFAIPELQKLLDSDLEKN